MWSATRRAVHQEDETPPPYHTTPPTFGVAQTGNTPAAPPRQLNNWGPPPPTNTRMTESFVAAPTAPRGLPPVLQRRHANTTQQQHPSHNVASSTPPPPQYSHSTASWQPSPPPQEKPEVEHYGDEEYEEDEDGGALTTTINLVASAASALFQRATAASPNPKVPPSTTPHVHNEIMQPVLQPPAPAILSPTSSMLDTPPALGDSNLHHESIVQAPLVVDTVSSNTSTFNTPTTGTPNNFASSSPANSMTAGSTPPSHGTSIHSTVTTPRRQLPTPQPPSTHHRSFLQRPPPAMRSSPRQHTKPKFKLPPPVPHSLGIKKATGTPPTSAMSSPPITPSSLTSHMLPRPVESTNATPHHVMTDFQAAIAGEASLLSTTTEPPTEILDASALRPVPVEQAFPPIAFHPLPVQATAPPGPPPPAQVMFPPTNTVTITHPTQATPWVGVPPPANVGAPPPAAATNVAPPPLPHLAATMVPEVKLSAVAAPPATFPSVPPTAPPIATVAPPPAGPPPPGVAPPTAVSSVPPAAPPAVFPAAPPVGHLTVFPVAPPVGPPKVFSSAPPVGPPISFPAAPPVAPPAPFPAASPVELPAAPPAAPLAGPAAPSTAPVGPPNAAHAAATHAPARPLALAPALAAESVYPLMPPATTPGYPSGAHGFLQTPAAPVAVTIAPPLNVALVVPVNVVAPPPVYPQPPPSHSTAPPQPPAPPMPKATIPSPIVTIASQPSPHTYVIDGDATSVPLTQPYLAEDTSNDIASLASPPSYHGSNSSYVPTLEANLQQEQVQTPRDQEPTFAPHIKSSLEQGTTTAQPPEREVPGDETNHAAVDDEVFHPNGKENEDDGWVQEWDADSGLPYYYNVHTQETTWQKPVSRRGDNSSNEELNASWLSSVDDNVNEHRRQQEEQSATPESTLLSVTKDLGETTENGDYPPLPDGWLEVLDESSGQSYYCNIVTQETTWDRPIVLLLDTHGDLSESVNPEAVVDQVTQDDTMAVTDSAVPESTWFTEQQGEECNSPREMAGNDDFATHDNGPEAAEESSAAPMNGQTTSEADVSQLPIDGDQSHFPEIAREKETEESLPEGWCELPDPQSGLTYYYNEVTQETTWERPPPTELGEGVLDVRKEFKWNEADESTVEKLDEQDTMTQNEDTTDNPEPRLTESEIPEGWIQELDETSGLPYYVNTVTNEATWDRPVDTADTADEDKLPDSVLSRDILAEEDNETMLTNRVADPNFEFETVERESSRELPPGWVRGVDRSSGRPYYYFFDDPVLTRSWIRPSNPEVPEHLVPLFEEVEDDESMPLPEGWVENIDPSTGKTFYYLEEDKIRTSTWRRPSDSKTDVPAFDVLQEQMAGNAEVNTHDNATVVEEETETNGPVSTADIEELPEGWTKHVDPASGLPFYFNAVENITTWEPPEVSFGNEINNVGTDLEDDGKEEGEIAASQPEQAKEGNLLMDTQKETFTEMTNPGTSSTDDMLQINECAEVASQDDLPDGWEELLDESSGLKYYFNAYDNTNTTWEKPVEQHKELLDAESKSQLQDECLTEPSPEEEIYVHKHGSEPQIDAAVEEDDAPEETGAGNCGKEINEENANDVMDSMPQNPELEIEQVTFLNNDTAPLLESLPPGWAELMDPDSGIKYYVFEPDGTSTWERPKPMELAEGAEDSVIPSESTECQNLPPPAGLDGDASSALSGSQQGRKDPTDEVESVVGTSSVVEAALPPGWVELTDPTSGDPYYFHEADNVAVWERPKVLAEGNELLDEKPDSAHHVGSSYASQPFEPFTENEQTVREALGNEVSVFNAGEGTLPSVQAEYSDKATSADSKDDSSNLPIGWVELTDTDSGTPYYFNETENITTWEKPTGKLAKPPTEVEDYSLRSVSDANQGKVKPDEHLEEVDALGTAEQHHDGETSVEEVVPLSEGWVEASDPASASESEIKNVTEINFETNQVSNELPQGWVQVVDSVSGKPFYFNESENFTTWELPVSKLQQLPAESIISKQDEGGANPEDVDVVPDKEPANVDTSTELHQRDGKPEVQQATTLPRGWVEVMDSNSGLPYYLNQGLNITTWDRPVGVDETQERESSTTTLSEKDEKATLGRDKNNNLPSGWVESVDPSTGQVFFFNEKENLSTWVRPGCDKELTKTSQGNEPLKRLMSHSFATFGFSGRLCTWGKSHGHIVALHCCKDVTPFDDVANVERAKGTYGIEGPLNSCEESSVMQYLEGRAMEKPEDLLWSLIVIAAKAKGRLRSDEGVRNPDGPEAAIVSLLLRDSDIVSVNTNGGSTLGNHEGTNGSKISLEKVQSLLLRGKREEAVQEALVSHNYAMALLVSTMCDRECYQRAVKEYADHALTVGSPLHTISLLFSAQLQPLAERALDGSETNSSIWGHNAEELRKAWKYHLAAIISNRTVGWDKIVLTLGDRLLELGDVKDAHFCYMVCGSPLSSPSNPSSRMAIVGCDHLVPMDVALMTTEGIDAYERSEAYEWAKRLGNRSAVIQSLQPFKLIYASLLCDLSFKATANRYLQSIRLCTGLNSTVQKGNAHPSPFAPFSDRAALAAAIDAIETRLHTLATPERKDRMEPQASEERFPPTTRDVPSTSNSKTESKGEVVFNDDEMTFVSAISNLPDVTAISPISRESGLGGSQENTVGSVEQESNSGSVEKKPFKVELNPTISGTLLETKRTSNVATNDRLNTPATTKSSIRSPRGTLRTRKNEGVPKKNPMDGKKRPSEKKEKKVTPDAKMSSPKKYNQLSATEGGRPPTLSSHHTGAPSSKANHVPEQKDAPDQLALLSLQARTSPNSVAGPPKVVTTEKQENSSKATTHASPVSAPLPGRQEPPMSAPAVMSASDNKKQSRPPAAPSSEKKGGSWTLGIKAKVTKWLNPDAKIADPGEEMQAYYDEKRKVWVFPGEDPDEKVKPIPPPPTTPLGPDATATNQPETPRSNDPLAAMMAPPKRTPASLPRGVGARAPSAAASRHPLTSPGGGPPPQFAVFQPKPATSS